MSKSKSIILPTAEEVPALTDRIVEINAQIGRLVEEKKGIEARLEAYALTQHQEPLKDETREGRKVTLPGTRHRLPIIFTSDLMMKSFKNGSAKHQELRSILAFCGADSLLSDDKTDAILMKFFSPPNTWEVIQEDGKKFRAAVAAELPEKIAPKFIAACTQTDKHGVKKSNTAFDYKAATAVDGKEPQ